MGNTYVIYTEANIDGKWRCIDGFYYHKPYGEIEEKLCLMATYINGSRSYFGETYDELRHIGRSTPFTDLSPEIQEHEKGAKYSESFFGNDSDDKKIASYITVPLKDFLDHTPKGFQYHGIYHKNTIAMYENGEIEDLWQDEEIDYSNLSKKEKKCYDYKEWDDPCGWQYNFKKLKERIIHTINKYECNEWCIDSPEYRIVVFEF